jgi:hypothetical protein
MTGWSSGRLAAMTTGAGLRAMGAMKTPRGPSASALPGGSWARLLPCAASRAGALSTCPRRPPWPPAAMLCRANTKEGGVAGPGVVLAAVQTLRSEWCLLLGARAHHAVPMPTAACARRSPHDDPCTWAAQVTCCASSHADVCPPRFAPFVAGLVHRSAVRSRGTTGNRRLLSSGPR